VIDGCPFSTDLVVSYKIYEQAKHITEVVLWEGPSQGVWISELSWKELTPSQQKIFIKTAEKARVKQLAPTQKAEQDARKFLKDQGVKFHIFPDEELKKWRDQSPHFFSCINPRLT